MFRTFNMGIGMVLVVGPRSTSRVLAMLADLGEKAWIIGELIKGNNSVEII